MPSVPSRALKPVDSPAPWVERMTMVNRLLAEATDDPQRASRVWDLAEAARVYAVQCNLGIHAINHAVAVKLKSQILLAEAVDAGQEAGEIARKGSNQHRRGPAMLSDEPKSLEDIGVKHQRVSESRKIRDAFTLDAIDEASREASIEGRELTSSEMLAEAKRITSGHRAHAFTGENEWYTPGEYVEMARTVMGFIDLDPASSELAQGTVLARRYFTAETDGLAQPWAGRVWLNPPYAQPLISHFVTKLVTEVTAVAVTEAILLTHNYTDTGWFHEAESAAAALCFTRGRIKFVNAAGEIASPVQGQTFFYYGPNRERFAETFRKIGFVR